MTDPSAADTPQALSPKDRLLTLLEACACTSVLAYEGTVLGGVAAGSALAAFGFVTRYTAFRRVLTGMESPADAEDRRLRAARAAAHAQPTARTPASVPTASPSATAPTAGSSPGTPTEHTTPDTPDRSARR